MRSNTNSKTNSCLTQKNTKSSPLTKLSKFSAMRAVPQEKET